MIEIEVLAITGRAAVLAGILVALENIVACKFHFLFGDVIINQKENDPRNAQPQRDRSNRFRVGFLSREVLPLCEAEGLKRAVVTVEDRLSVPLKEERQSAARGANVDRLPQPVQHEHVLV